MTQVVLQIENENDLQSILTIAQQLNIKHFTTNTHFQDSNVLTESEHNHRKNGLSKFRGILKANNGYYPSKSELYEQ